MKYDVVIVGAGPAGSTTAKFLSKSGASVLLLEKETLPRDKPCGGGLPIRVLHRYPYINKEQTIEAYSSSGSVFSPTAKYKIDVDCTKPFIATVIRKKFDSWLINDAKNAGALLQENAQVVDVKTEENQITVILKDGSIIPSEIVVGADGVNSVVAKAAGLQKHAITKGICLFQEFEVDEQVLDQYFRKTRHCYIHSKFKRIDGYGWVFPKKEHLNIGIGAIQISPTLQQDKTSFLCDYKEYIGLLQKENLIPKDLKQTPIQGGRLPTRPLDQTYADRLLLVGDAAGFINPLSGEGVYYAMASGQIAAEVINEALQKKCFDARSLSTYERRWRKDFGGDISLMLKMANRRKTQKSDNLFKIALTDPPLIDLIIGVITGSSSIHKNKWRLTRRYLYASLKYHLLRHKIHRNGIAT